MKLFGNKKKKPYSSKDILKQLDQCAEEFSFPMLDNGYVYPVSSRLKIFRDATRWVIIIEVVGFSYRGGGHNGISNCLHVFGNCLDFAPGTNNNNFIYFTSDSDEGATFDIEYLEHLNPEVKTIKLRDKKIKINHHLKYYHDLGIKLEEPPKIMIWEFLRGLLPDYRNDMLAFEDEIRTRIPRDLPEFMSLDKWHHIDLAGGEKPSNSETFQMLAKATVSGLKADYQPTQAPNNHWSNWPEGGTL